MCELFLEILQIPDHQNQILHRLLSKHQWTWESRQFAEKRSLAEEEHRRETDRLYADAESLPLPVLLLCFFQYDQSGHEYAEVSLP